MGGYGSENVPIRNRICIFVVVVLNVPRFHMKSLRSGRTKLQTRLTNRAMWAGLRINNLEFLQYKATSPV